MRQGRFAHDRRHDHRAASSRSPCSSTSSTRSFGPRSSRTMTINGWLQILLFCVVRPARSRSRSGSISCAVYDGSAALARRPSSARSTRLRRRRRARISTGRATPRRCCCSASRRCCSRIVVLRLQHVLPLNPQHFAGGDRPAGVRDGGVVHDEHQLAVVRRRDDDVVLLADDAARLSQLRVGGGRHGGRRRARARDRAAGRRARSATSGSTSCAARSTCCCRCRSCSRSLLVQQGVIQNFSAVRRRSTTLEGAKQTIAMGPVASQEAIKQLGTNGGGFFNANAAHPFENPTPWTNFLSMFTIFAIPSALDVHVRPDGGEPEARLGACGRRCSCSSSPA